MRWVSWKFSTVVFLRSRCLFVSFSLATSMPSLSTGFGTLGNSIYPGKCSSTDSLFSFLFPRLLSSLGVAKDAKDLCIFYRLKTCTYLRDKFVAWPHFISSISSCQKDRKKKRKSTRAEPLNCGENRRKNSAETRQRMRRKLVWKAQKFLLNRNNGRKENTFVEFRLISFVTSLFFCERSLASRVCNEYDCEVHACAPDGKNVGLWQWIERNTHVRLHEISRATVQLRFR